ncbi:hypothetical protein JTB14_018727 [Gonioctena quinquepunctata]|nr:hypothetical protein JTB14_018727 [Gonioctena quinquepunctata]
MCYSEPRSIKKLCLNEDDAEWASRTTKWRWKKKCVERVCAVDSGEDTRELNNSNEHNDAMLTEFEDSEMADLGEANRSKLSFNNPFNEDYSTDEGDRDNINGYDPEDSSITGGSRWENNEGEILSDNEEIINIEDNRSPEPGNNASDGNHCEENPKHNPFNFFNYFPDSGLNEIDIKAMITGFSLRHGLSREGTKDLIQLIEVLANKKLTLTNYLINKTFASPEEVVQYHFYCIKCKYFLETSVKSQITGHKSMCERCEFENTISRNSDNYFILLDLKYQLKCFLETAEIQQYLNSFNFNNDNENMTDVHDGQIFKNLRSSQRKFSYTYNFNTDGAAVFNSSKLSMWPIQLVINELPPSKDSGKYD